ncbi:helix-turn-helix domain-containing protein [Glutamicibacter ardleyensis]|uniref:helix-turn-helix domain-containing protein n=1 Tax=Glutamicibacter ardleyensis TaxID=225894 RepID=UPI003FD581A4
MSTDNGRARIRKAAAGLFGERGFHDVTVREIAEIAEVSPRVGDQAFWIQGRVIYGREHGHGSTRRFGSSA